MFAVEELTSGWGIYFVTHTGEALLTIVDTYEEARAMIYSQAGYEVSPECNIACMQQRMIEWNENRKEVDM